jgi:NitT/TauT family transport system ATP-binding protein
MIKVENIFKSYGVLEVFDDFSLEFPEGKITAVLGPSGCGKTTLLNILAGLVKIEQGKVYSPGQVSYLFQEPRLLPWLTIRQNIAFVLQGKMPLTMIQERIEAHLSATGLADFGDYYPVQLSGGMKQRAAIARAFAFDAPLLLMDEPFKSLDIKTRFELLENFLQLWMKAPRTVITVTHDPKEAVALGELIVVLGGKPAMVHSQRDINVSQTQRKNHPGLITMEHELYKLLLS